VESWSARLELASPKVSEVGAYRRETDEAGCLYYNIAQGSFRLPVLAVQIILYGHILNPLLPTIEMVEPIGATGLAIAIVGGAIKVLKFIDKWIDDSKQFGQDVRAFKTRLSTEIARLDSLSEFLDQKSTDGKPRLEQLSVTFQRATKGMVQELQITLASYEPLVEKYKIEDLKRGFDYTLPSALDGLSITDTAQLKEDGEKEAKERQKKATFLETAAWGLFQKKKISALLVDITTWNDQLQSLLLCSLLFGNGPKVSRATPVEIW
jgi:hypothetical protein